MFGDNSTRLSITSRGLHQQLVTGIALISIIPILVLWLRWTSRTEDPENPAELIIHALVLATGFAGYSLLRRSADNVVSLRRSVEDVVRSKGLPQVLTESECDDVLAIRKCTELLVDQLKQEYAALQIHASHVEQNLSRATKLDSMGCMAAGISHDLDNVFTAILGNTDIILRYAKPDATTVEHIRQIESAANRALETIRAIRLCAGRGTFSAKKINTAEFIRQIDGALVESLPPHQPIRYEITPDAPNITADPDYLRTVVLNLVTNAADAMRENPGTIVISVGSVACDRDCLSRAYFDEGLPEGNYAYIDVSDCGPGIASAIQEKMFDPFYSGHIRGRGLGLALVMGIVRTHSGAVLVDTSPDKGTTFRILLPTDETRLKLPPERASRESLEAA